MGLARHCYAIFITPPRAFRQRGPGPSGALSGAGMYPASAAIFMLRKAPHSCSIFCRENPMKSVPPISNHAASCPFLPQTLSGARRKITGPRAGAVASKEIEYFPPVDRFGFFPEGELVFGQKIIASHEVLAAFDFSDQIPMRYEQILEYVELLPIVWTVSGMI